MDEARPIRVLVVDDHIMVRRGLAVFLQAFDDFHLVGEAGTGGEAIRLCEELHPDVVLMDLRLPEIDGFQATREIRSNHPDIQIVALTSYLDEVMVQESLRAGAIGYLLKDAGVEELAAAIRSANCGKSTISPEAVQALVNASQRPEVPGKDLTPREEEVLTLMVEGLHNPGIAERLGVSLSTVKSHVSNILAKLGVGNRVEAVALAVEYGLPPDRIQPPPTGREHSPPSPR